MPAPLDPERYTGARATPDLIGRRTIRDAIDAAILQASPGPALVVLHGQGGIGKTRLLHDTISRNVKGQDIYLAAQPVDLYDIRQHSDLNLAEALVAALEQSGATAFRNFEQARVQQRRAQASGDVRELARKTREALDAFSGDLRRFAEQRRVVLTLDTLERVVYGAGQRQHPFEIAQSWQWLVNSLPTWGNVTIFTAGRPQVQHLFEAIKKAAGVTFTPILVGPFTQEETLEYFEAVARIATESGETGVAEAIKDISPARMRLAHSYSGGLPILLSLLIDYLSLEGFGRLPKVFDDEVDEASARKHLEQQIIERLMRTRSIKDTLRAMGRAPKGVDAPLLAAILGDTTPSQAQARLKEIEPLSFVKIRNERYFLHDEMYIILNRQDFSAEGDAEEAYRTNEAIIKWYDAQIAQARQKLDDLYAPVEQPHRPPRLSQRLDYDQIGRIQQEIQRLLIDQLYYHLRLDSISGFQEFFRLTFYAVFTGNVVLDVQAQAEILAYLDERDPDATAEQIDGLERAVVIGVASTRPVARFYAQNNYDAAINEALRVRQERSDLAETAGGTTRAALYIWEALARIDRASSDANDGPEAERLLAKAIGLLQAVVGKTPREDVNDARRWRAWSLLALAYHAQAFRARAKGLFKTAIKDYRRAANIWRLVDVQVCLAWTLNNLGFLVSEEGDPAEGRALVEEGLQIRRRLSERALTGVSHATLAQILRSEGAYDAAVASAERALQLFNAVEYKLGIGLALRNLAECKRRMSGTVEDPNERVNILREARDHAQDARRVFEGIDEKLRQVESLIEEGCAYRDWVQVRQIAPAPADDIGRLVFASVDALTRAAALAHQTDNRFREVDALVNMAYVGLYAEQPELIKSGLRDAQNLIDPVYLITREGPPDPSSAVIQVRGLFSQLAKMHMLVANSLFAIVEGLRQPRAEALPQAAAGEYMELASILHTQPHEQVRSRRDVLTRAIHHLVLAFEYDRLFGNTSAEARGAQGRIVDRLKRLHSDDLATVEEAVKRAEQDYNLGRSQLHRLLVSRALLSDDPFE